MTDRNTYVAQNVFSVMARFDPSKLTGMNEQLRLVRSEWYRDQTSHTHRSPLRFVRTLHFARFVVIKPNIDASSDRLSRHYGPDREYKYYRPYLMLETWYDGPLDEHLDDLLSLPPDDSVVSASTPETIRSLFSLCDDCQHLKDCSDESLKEFLLEQNHRHQSANTPFVAARGRSKRQILDEQLMYAEIRKYVDEKVSCGAWPDRDPVAIHADIRRKFVPNGSEIQIGETRLPPPPPTLKGLASAIDRASLGDFVWYAMAAIFGVVVTVFVLGAIPSIAFLLFDWRPSWRWGAATSITLTVGFAMLAYLVVILRWHERRDDEYEVKLIDSRRYVKNEDHVLQNPMTSAIPVKHCGFRMALLRLVLALVRWDARYVSTSGQLSGISSIHFARWAIVGDPPLLLFTSNYNRSWESYLGEFVAEAARGLTLIWSNAQGFPRTRWLVTEGANNEQLFKAYSRQAMSETQLWYSAYWDITVREVLRNTEIRRGLFEESLDADRARAWVELL